MPYDRDTHEVMVADLRPRMKHLNITFKVLDKGDLREVESRRDGTTHYLLTMKVGDSTGTVLLPVWDDLVDYFKVGETYRLVNGYASVYRGHLRLNIGRYGRISESSFSVEEVDRLNNMSSERHAPRPPRFRNRRHDFRHRSNSHQVKPSQTG
jgi:replication factor A1